MLDDQDYYYRDGFGDNYKPDSNYTGLVAIGAWLVAMVFFIWVLVF